MAQRVHGVGASIRHRRTKARSTAALSRVALRYGDTADLLFVLTFKHIIVSVSRPMSLDCLRYLARKVYTINRYFIY